MKRAAFRDQTYWGKPVPSFGPIDASLLIVGLAPAAHGANRTGRMFTGDRSGDFLYRALYEVGLASQPEAWAIDDGLELYGVRIASPVRCAPPQNKPTPKERDRCSPFLREELGLMKSLRSVVVLGAFGWQAFLPLLGPARPKFGHGVEVEIGGLRIFGCYHVSQQNTFTGKLTQEMLQDVLRRAWDASKEVDRKPNQPTV
ncbi:uracil-DNA glycosylase [Lentzea flava]|uniref:Type-5 uracil-DNA glycosylase n=1 Tax=Lentzea flava TaxID=103732 RepID=A0ABQ2V594_9PSEU|nr:uracil-DNA glycosylase, family 4 [Lentzea flava]GGU67785.1 uracil-DNA glycosylase [Lentzea flava]